MQMSALRPKRFLTMSHSAFLPMKFFPVTYLSYMKGVSIAVRISWSVFLLCLPAEQKYQFFLFSCQKVLILQSEIIDMVVKLLNKSLLSGRLRSKTFKFYYLICTQL